MKICQLSKKELPLILSLFQKIDDIEKFRFLLGFELTPEIIVQKTFKDPDYNPELFIGAYEDFQLVGCVMAVQRPWKKGLETAWIKFILVNGNLRSKGIGSALLNRIENSLFLRNVKKIVFGSSSPNYFVPGLPQCFFSSAKWFESRNWKVSSERINLFTTISKGLVHLGLSSEKNKFRYSKYQISEVTSMHRNDLNKFISTEFSESWAREINLVYTPTQDHFAVIVQEIKSLNICGFAAIGATNSNWLGPMGISKNLRGKGLGKLLLYGLFLAAQSRGLETIIIPWVNEENIHFYHHCVNATIHQKYWKLEKKVNNSNI